MASQLSTTPDWNRPGANAISLKPSNPSIEWVWRYGNVTEGHRVFNWIVLCSVVCPLQWGIGGGEDGEHQAVASVPVGDEPEVSRDIPVWEKHSGGAGHRAEQVKARDAFSVSATWKKQHSSVFSSAVPSWKRLEMPKPSTTTTPADLGNSSSFTSRRAETSRVDVSLTVSLRDYIMCFILEKDSFKM